MAPRSTPNIWSYVYLGWLATNEKEGLTVLDAYESLDLGERGSDIRVPQGQGTGGSHRLFRFRDGIERFLITDINNPAVANEATRRVPVIWEWPENHNGGYVLYLDGHVEFVPYPGKFPMTATFQNRLRAISAGKRAP
jgi:prepilin-type processing-associated H-X9-DG protein